METLAGLGAATWRVAPHSAFLGRKDDLRRVADAIIIASGSEEQGDQSGGGATLFGTAAGGLSFPVKCTSRRHIYKGVHLGHAKGGI
jgi:hypothetical protein